MLRTNINKRIFNKENEVSEIVYNQINDGMYIPIQESIRKTEINLTSRLYIRKSVQNIIY